MWNTRFLGLSLLIFFFVTTTGWTAQSMFTLMVQTTSLGPRKRLLGVWLTIKFFKRDFIYLKNPKGNFAWESNQSKSQITLDYQEIVEKFQWPTYTKLGQGIELWRSFRLARLLAVEFVIPSSSTRQSTYNASMVEVWRQCLCNMNRKSWSHYPLITPLPVSNAPRSQNKHSTIINNQGIV